ncbi:2OG-Fe(II) oxygenase [Algoriphagus machipongonensis]|uniref:Oxidoreductase, 2OG-Fe(II) oxygenase family n=1 Tax=Algoriphagus machipongonensis TaxID=388413 RepID=A3I1A9_9BACT|nr:2OG-Fe(II) oxygenase [Algoriphagus machipongonensis]EAZ79575.1 oxidoreductase, 2OG-Fe(II) oxygenase family [Algoriphagus machipongonensis]
MESVYERIASEIYDKSYAIVDDFISEDLRASLLQEQTELLEAGKFRLAAVGKGEKKQIRTEIRNDQVLWLNPDELSRYESIYWGEVEKVRLAINQRCYMGLKSFEGHFARYPKGSFYVRHMDQFQQVIYRQVTVIIYLNDSWSEEDAGMLRMYLPQANGSEEILDISPIGGRLVVFLSGEIPHEVLPTNKERISITGWLKDID